MGQRLPGIVCTITRGDWVDSGTSCRNRSHPPGPDTGDREIVDLLLEDEKKKKYLSHAKMASYAMQGEGILGGKEKLSFLGGKFLRMYLDHKLDPDAVKTAGEEIAATPAWKDLAKKTAAHVDRYVDRFPRPPSEKEVADAAREFLKRRLKPASERERRKPRIEFRGALNAVIGGVRDIDVGREAVFLKTSDTAKGLLIEYQIDVTLHDTYDFANNREGEYDMYRKRLARFLRKNDFCRFEVEYWGEMCPGEHGPRTKLNSKAVLFASFMYALEVRGWTPGPLPWHVTIPMTESLTYKKRSKTAASGR